MDELQTETTFSPSYERGLSFQTSARMSSVLTEECVKQHLQVGQVLPRLKLNDTLQMSI